MPKATSGVPDFTVCVLHMKLIISTHLHPAQPVSVPMPPRDMSCVVTNSVKWFFA